MAASAVYLCFFKLWSEMCQNFIKVFLKIKVILFTQNTVRAMTGVMTLMACMTCFGPPPLQSKVVLRNL